MLLLMDRLYEWVSPNIYDGIRDGFVVNNTLTREPTLISFLFYVQY